MTEPPVVHQKGRGLGLFFALEIVFLVFGFFAATGFSRVVYGNDAGLFNWLAQQLPSPFNAGGLYAAYLVGSGFFLLVGNLLVIGVGRGRRRVYGAAKP